MKKRGREYKSDTEAKVEAQRLVDYVELVYEFAQRQAKRDAKLKDHPKGYPIDEQGVYMCLLCRRAITNKNGWYDKYGFKCLDCQRALDKRAIPVTVMKNRKSWFADWQIYDEFGVHPSTVRKLIRQGHLHGRDLKAEDGEVYLTIYL